MGLEKGPVGKTGTLQAANLYLPICINPAPTLSIFGFVRVFPKFHMLGWASSLWKSWGLWFIFIVHRAKGILTWRGKDEFYTNHICVKEMWKARNTMTTGWEPSYSLCLPWHSSWNDVDLDTSSLLINRMVGFFPFSAHYCIAVVHRRDLTLHCY